MIIHGLRVAVAPAAVASPWSSAALDANYATLTGSPFLARSLLDLLPVVIR